MAMTWDEILISFHKFANFVLADDLVIDSHPAVKYIKKEDIATSYTTRKMKFKKITSNFEYKRKREREREREKVPKFRMYKHVRPGSWRSLLFYDHGIHFRIPRASYHVVGNKFPL